MRRRARFADVVERQLTIFAEEQNGLLADCDQALSLYDSATPAEAEERYGDYVDLVDAGRDALEDLREAYSRTLDEAAADEYRQAFNERARRRFRHFARDLE